MASASIWASTQAYEALQHGARRGDADGVVSSAGLVALRRPCQFVGYVGEESPVEGGWVEEEKSSCSKRAILALLSCSCFKRLSLSSDAILCLSVSCSMS